MSALSWGSKQWGQLGSKHRAQLGSKLRARLGSKHQAPPGIEAPGPPGEKNTVKIETGGAYLVAMLSRAGTGAGTGAIIKATRSRPRGRVVGDNNTRGRRIGSIRRPPARHVIRSRGSTPRIVGRAAGTRTPRTLVCRSSRHRRVLVATRRSSTMDRAMQPDAVAGKLAVLLLLPRDLRHETSRSGGELCSSAARRTHEPGRRLG